MKQLKTSAGLLPFRLTEAGQMEFFLVHPGGPFNKNKDAGVWSIPKGEVEPDRDFLSEAKREFLEETGFIVDGDFLPLQPIIQKSGKTVYAWAILANFDEKLLQSNSFEMEWPPKSGNKQEFPEVDKGAWLSLEEAKLKINPAQFSFLEELTMMVRNADKKLIKTPKIC